MPSPTGKAHKIDMIPYGRHQNAKERTHMNVGPATALHRATAGESCPGKLLGSYSSLSKSMTDSTWGVWGKRSKANALTGLKGVSGSPAWEIT